MRCSRARARSGTPEDAALYRYGATAGDAGLKEALAADARGRGLESDGTRNVFVGVGGTHAFFCAARPRLLDNDDEVLCLAPYWPGAPGVLGSCGARAVEVIARPDLPAAGGRGGDAEGLRRRLAAALTPRTRAIYLVTPNNPDGSVLTRAELEAVAEIAGGRDLWIFADEVYRDFTFDGRTHLSIAALPGMSARTLIIGSFSKSHALAGARVGFVLAPEEVILAMRRVSTHTIFSRAAARAGGGVGGAPAWRRMDRRGARAVRRGARCGDHGARRHGHRRSSGARRDLRVPRPHAGASEIAPPRSSSGRPSTAASSSHLAPPLAPPSRATRASASPACLSPRVLTGVERLRAAL